MEFVLILPVALTLFLTGCRHLWRRDRHRSKGHVDGAYRHGSRDAIFIGFAGRPTDGDGRLLSHHGSLFGGQRRRDGFASPGQFRWRRHRLLGASRCPPAIRERRGTSPLLRFPSTIATPGAYYILGEVSYKYTPTIGYMVTGPFVLHDQTYGGAPRCADGGPLWRLTYANRARAPGSTPGGRGAPAIVWVPEIGSGRRSARIAAFPLRPDNEVHAFLTQKRGAFRLQAPTCSASQSAG